MKIQKLTINFRYIHTVDTITINIIQKKGK